MATPGGVAELAASVRARAEFPAGPLLIALSGGADSAAAAWAATETGASVRAVFVDHGLAASQHLRRAAEDIASRLQLPLDVVVAPVDEATSNFEDTARELRYAALVDAAKPD